MIRSLGDLQTVLTNLERYKKDLDKLLHRGASLFNAIQVECYPEEVEAEIERQLHKGADPKRFQEFKKPLPEFKQEYQGWYSESVAVIRQLLPDRLSDFIKLYEKPKNRKEITHENYVIEDYCHGLIITRGFEKKKVVGPEAAISRFEQQLYILQSVKQRFESSLFD